MDLRDYLLRMQADAAEALKLVPAAPSQSASITLVGTAPELTNALKAGGTYRLLDGVYAGNFIVTKPITLIGSRAAVLVPADPLLPTISVQASDCTLQGFTIRNGAKDRECVVVGDYSAIDAAKQPARVTLDALSVEAGEMGGRRGIALHGSALTVKNCRVTGFWFANADAQAILILNGPGPYTVIDNYLEGSGEVIMAGGSSIKIPNCVPSDILIARNVCYKPEAWRTNGATVKNSIEIKAGRRVIIEDNLCDGNWAQGQDGNPLVLTVRNQDGDNPWVIVDDITIRRNRTVRCKEGYAVSILGLDTNHPSQQTQRVLIEGNLFTDSPGGFAIGNGVATDLTIRRNTLPAVSGNLLKFDDTHTPHLMTPLTFTGNVAKGGAYGVSALGLTIGLPALQALATLVNFSGNIIEKTAERTIAWPAGNTLIEPGALAALLDPTTFKLLAGTAGY